MIYPWREGECRYDGDGYVRRLVAAGGVMPVGAIQGVQITAWGLWIVVGRWKP